MEDNNWMADTANYNSNENDFIDPLEFTLNWVYNCKEPSYQKWWIDLCDRAAVKDETHLVGTKLVYLHRKQLIDGVNSLARRWKADRKQVRWFLNSLKETGMITYYYSHNISIITITEKEYIPAKLDDRLIFV